MDIMLVTGMGNPIARYGQVDAHLLMQDTGMKRFILYEDEQVVADETYITLGDDEAVKRIARALGDQHGLVLTKIRAKRA